MPLSVRRILRTKLLRMFGGKIIKPMIRRWGFDLIQYYGEWPVDFGQEDIDIIRAVKPYTMTSKEMVFGLIQAVKYVVRANIPGSIVECGVWRGGSVIAIVSTLMQLGKPERDLYLFDTYEGMTLPTDVDIDFKGRPAAQEYPRVKRADASGWYYGSIEDVQDNVFRTGYDPNRLRFIKGRIEDTIPSSAPDEIALLRLDTDWYESTRHELVHLYPRLSMGGVLIIDDYGTWRGSRKATDEYFQGQHGHILLNRIDDGRIGVKLSGSTET